MMTDRIYTPKNCDPRNLWKDSTGKYWCIKGITPGVPMMEDSHLQNTILFLERAAKKQAYNYNNMSNDEKIRLALFASAGLKGEQAQASVEDDIIVLMNDDDDNMHPGYPDVEWQSCLSNKYWRMVEERDKRISLEWISEEDWTNGSSCGPEYCND